MPPIVKDTVAPGSPVIATNNDHRLLQMPAAYRPNTETAGRVQPVALEVPVAVNGSRTTEGSDTREPFSETTKTVLVFGNGAVIRLTAPVAAGQLFFLTNEKTRREVVCQVVKSKTYRNVSGYVEIEFTEPSPGFWGVRFPSDRIGPVRETAASPLTSSPSASSPISLPSQQKPEAPSTVFQKPRESFSSAPAVEAPSSDSSFDSFPFAPPTVAPKIAAFNKPVAPPIQAPEQAAKSLDELLAEITAMSPLPAKPTTQPVAPANSKLDASVLQRQLSSFLFADQQNSASSSEDVSSKSSLTPSLPDSVSNASPTSSAASWETKIDNLPPPSSRVSTDAPSEEIALPTWLLPKVSAAHVADRSTELAAKLESAPLAPEPATISEPSPQVEDSVTESFGTLTEGLSVPGSQAAGSRKSLWIGVAAAALLLSAGGYWYFQQSTSTIAAASVASSPASKANVPSSDVAIPSRTSAVPSDANAEPVKAALAASGSSSAKNSPPSGLVADAPVLATPPPISQSRAPSLGKLRLAAPIVQRKALSADNIQVPTLDGQPSTASMGANFAGASAQPGAPAVPTAPLAIGGNVTPARLLSSVQPAYSSMARSQHVSGDVKIDALIDANGRVTTVKILSGPPLLEQSAVDALRQWKYRPAMLNGKPVSMHLTVTLQFRLQ